MAFTLLYCRYCMVVRPEQCFADYGGCRISGVGCCSNASGLNFYDMIACRGRQIFVLSDPLKCWNAVCEAPLVRFCRPRGSPVRGAACLWLTQPPQNWDWRTCSSIGTDNRYTLCYQKAAYLTFVVCKL